MASTYNTLNVASTPTLMMTSRDRKGSMITNISNQIVYLGMNSQVSVSNGFPLPPNSVFNNSGQIEVWKGDIYGIVPTGTSECRYWEWEL